MQPVVTDFLAKNPNLPVAYTGSAHDIVQVGYYALLAKSFGRDGVGFNGAFAYAALKFPPYLMDTLAAYGNESAAYSNYIVDTKQHCFVEDDATFAEEEAPPGAPGTTTSLYAPCADADADADECAERESMGKFVSDFLNVDAAEDGTPEYPANFPSAWHLMCEKAEGVCGPDFPAGDGTSAPTEEQTGWLKSKSGRERFREAFARLNHLPADAVPEGFPAEDGAPAGGTAANDTSQAGDGTESEGDTSGGEGDGAESDDTSGGSPHVMKAVSLFVIGVVSSLVF